MLAIIREQLEMITGVSPSTHWLEDCLSALQIQNTDVEVASAAVLEQILHHDLRDVVRTFDEVSSSSSSCEAAAQSLRRAIEQSRMGETRRAVLPATFRLLVQVEELLDVSSNAEIRLAVGPSSTAPLGNQNARCLKVCYSDGFCTTGRSAYSENEEVQQKPLVAMELTPVPKMSANSLAGVKVLLTGPITIRHGIAGWHAGNAAVLGGCVPELVQIQKQALQLAKQRAGHGVDPTVKALIWNHQQQDGYEDEGKRTFKGANWFLLLLLQNLATKCDVFLCSNGIQAILLNLCCNKSSLSF